MAAAAAGEHKKKVAQVRTILKSNAEMIKINKMRRFFEFIDRSIDRSIIDPSKNKQNEELMTFDLF